jgi:hypothetical protein
MTRNEFGTADRRGILKGMGALALPSMTDDSAATGTQSGLDVVHVEPGWTQFGGGWESADGHVDTKSAFDVRIDVSGTSQDSVLAYFVGLAGPNGGFVAVQGSHVEDTYDGSTSIHHGNPATRAFRPDLIISTVPEGRYWLYAAVTDRSKAPVNAFAGGISDAFEIS